MGDLLWTNLSALTRRGRRRRYNAARALRAVSKSVETCALPLDALARRAGIGRHETAGIGLDLTRNRVLCANGAEVPFDLLSIDTGPEPALAGLPGAAEYALAVRPIERFIAAWPPLLERMLAQRGGFDLVVVGAGAGGVELAFAAQHRCAVAGARHVRISLVGSVELPLHGAPTGIRRRIARMLEARGMGWLGSRQATGVAPRELEFAEGAALPFDACLVVTGAAAPRWPSASGLATDADGFIRVGRTLQSLSHPNVFAAGATRSPLGADGASAVAASGGGRTGSIAGSCGSLPRDANSVAKRLLVFWISSRLGSRPDDIAKVLRRRRKVRAAWRGDHPLGRLPRPDRTTHHQPRAIGDSGYAGHLPPRASRNNILT